jgi:hypothetical protein
VHGEIIPDWPRGGFPVLKIPADRQKNDTHEAVPMLPAFERLLKETPEDGRTGYVFVPLPVAGGNARPSPGRPSPEWVSRIVSRIGEAAGVIVEPARGTPPPPPLPEPPKLTKAGKPRKVQPSKAKRPARTATYVPPKFASAHDLRRSCAERLLESGLPPIIIQQVMRHASWETTKRYYAPGDVQAAAAILHKAARREATGYTELGTHAMQST